MSVMPFMLGFLTAILGTGLVLAILLFHMKNVRRERPPIQGYLDLIPDLSREQRDTVQKIRESFLPRVQAIRDNLRLDRAELASLLFEEPPERSRISEVVGRILQHQAQLEKEVIEHILEERELLTPSQRRKFQEIIVEQFASGGLGVHDVKGRQQ